MQNFDDLSKTIANIVITKSKIIKHIHCHGVSSSSDFITKILNNLNSQKLNVRRFNCVNYSDNPKLLIDEIESEFSEAFLPERQKFTYVFLLLGVELICQGTSTTKEQLKGILKKIETSRNIKLITFSVKSWFVIQSNYLKVALSDPIQFNVGDSENDNIVASIASNLNYSHEFVDYVVRLMEFHYKKFPLLLHIVKKIGKECKLRGILLNEKIGPNSFAKIGAICVEFTRNDNAFSLNDMTNKSSDLQLDIAIKQENLFQFPILTKCAIIAVYCASYNPAFSDQIFFFKGRDLLKRNKRQAPTICREKLHDVGPKPFDRQRALFIFSYFWSNLLDDCCNGETLQSLNIDFNAQIMILLQASILQLVSATENLDEPKYRCLCFYSLAESVAKSLDEKLDLKSYLFDFASEA